MTREQRVQPRQCVDVLEALVEPRLRVPLIVAFGIDPYEQMHVNQFALGPHPQRVASPRSSLGPNCSHIAHRTPHTARRTSHIART